MDSNLFLYNESMSPLLLSYHYKNYIVLGMSHFYNLFQHMVYMLHYNMKLEYLNHYIYYNLHI